METITTHYTLADKAEITLEANPEDLSREKLALLAKTGINRLSIGIQTFDDGQLNYLNRSHNAEEAISSVVRAQELGFNNISIDLIYGIPASHHHIWENNLSMAMQLSVSHISAYCLTIEPATAFGRRRERGTLPPENEEFNATQFEMLMDVMHHHGYEHYEVSNFCKQGNYGKHNSTYWNGIPYCGIGPGAHSYNLQSRQFNIENNSKYCTLLEKGELPYTKEMLSAKTKANEYVMTGLRTKWGISLEALSTIYTIYPETLNKILDKYQISGHLITNGNHITLTKKGFMIADKITEELFIL
jgi:oxygen-independent coproporphyrinogen-3 oxidase